MRIIFIFSFLGISSQSGTTDAADWYWEATSTQSISDGLRRKTLPWFAAIAGSNIMPPSHPRPTLQSIDCTWNAAALMLGVQKQSPWMNFHQKETSKSTDHSSCKCINHVNCANQLIRIESTSISFNIIYTRIFNQIMKHAKLIHFSKWKQL